MTLDAVIATLSAQANLDGRGSEILAAAITLRDSTERDRKQCMLSNVTHVSFGALVWTLMVASSCC